METEELKKIVESALFAAGEPLSLDRLQGLFEEEERPEKAVLRETIEALQADCQGRGVELREVASGYRFQGRAETARWVSRLWEEKPARYSRALLETLALVVYRQPITRAEIEDIRGVSVSTNIMRTLQEREWVRVVGHRDVPGKPAMYATTRQFLDYFDLKTLDDLPPLAELRDIDKLNAELDLRLPGEETGGREPEEGVSLPPVDLEPVEYV
ncbi:SMC-Scp complex subunit ScpB [Thiohalomonas denitrificans]|uniref:Segregation and condensation protein B n=1 Tax=Thiohalomonas denitrificans TaxID=415747 RepID=A0A1G5PIQ1_9GAMM|nr:SMC-Scp complex subunit ScpB [Thiohalomonas denitrificans]SCZ49286.1 segregation and condensation protein B [Thiohalomonas denitrificans]